MKTLYFLGPKGTYSEFCAKKILSFLNENYFLKEVSTIPKIIDILNNTDDDIAVVPIENSIEGTVRPVIDNLYFSNVKIQAETTIEISHCLISKGKKSQIRNIVSHPQALSQCQKYILENFSENINLISSNSTADAVQILEKKSDDFAGIVSCFLAETLDYNIIDKNIADTTDNKTRFVLISKKELNLGKKIRTSIVFNTKNQSGALLDILSIFKKYNLNLIYLESRPSKENFGEYNFFADIDKSLQEIEPALNEIKEKCNFYKFLGSYCVLN